MRNTHIIRIAVIVVLCILAGALLWLLRPQSSRQHTLSSYLPSDTLFAVRMDRKSLTDVRSPVLKNFQHGDQLRTAAVTYIVELERKLNTKIVSILWFAYGAHKQGFILDTADEFTAKRIEELRQQEFSAPEWFPSGESLVLHALEPRRILLSSSEVPRAASSIDGSDAIDEQHWLSAILTEDSFNELMASLTASFNIVTTTDLFRSARSIAVSIDDSQSLFRMNLRTYGGAETKPMQKVALPLPEHPDFVYFGGALSSSTPVSLVALPRMRDIALRLGQNSGESAEAVLERLSSFNAVIVDGTTWAIIDSDSDSLRTFGAELTSWVRPGYRETTLPDKTRYREYVRKILRPVEQMVQGEKVLSWAYASSTAPAKGDIVLLSRSTTSLLTNDINAVQGWKEGYQGLKGCLQEKDSYEQGILLKDTNTSKTNKERNIAIFSKKNINSGQEMVVCVE